MFYQYSVYLLNQRRFLFKPATTFAGSLISCDLISIQKHCYAQAIVDAFPNSSSVMGPYLHIPGGVLELVILASFLVHFRSGRSLKFKFLASSLFESCQIMIELFVTNSF